MYNSKISVSNFSVFALSLLLFAMRFELLFGRSSSPDEGNTFLELHRVFTVSLLLGRELLLLHSAHAKIEMAYKSRYRYISTRQKNATQFRTSSSKLDLGASKNDAELSICHN
jgi:hypothetical protein